MQTCILNLIHRQEMEMSVLLVSVTLAICCLGLVQGFTYDDKEVETEEGKAAMFERWRSHHKLEAISGEDKKKQYNAFKANLEHVHKTNKANLPFKLQMNRFAGMSNQEFTSKYTGLKAGPSPNSKKLAAAPKPKDSKNDTAACIPPMVDWRLRGAVTPVKNQGQCGCCYAFAAVDAVEGIHAIRNKEIIELSTKEIVDCAKIGGCNGGRMTDTFQYIVDVGGLTTAKNYRYVAKEEPCNLQKENDIAVEIHGYHDGPRLDEDALVEAVAQQPVSVQIACEENFQLYKEGVMTSPCGITVLHAVLVVGYDTTPDGTKYWIIKNSWGEEWGDKGYIKMLRGVPEKEGYCGLAQWPSYPTIEPDSGPHPGGDPIVQSSKEL